jgi:hypothetical protein
MRAHGFPRPRHDGTAGPQRRRCAVRGDRAALVEHISVAMTPLGLSVSVANGKGTFAGTTCNGSLRKRPRRSRMQLPACSRSTTASSAFRPVAARSERGTDEDLTAACWGPAAPLSCSQPGIGFRARRVSYLSKFRRGGHPNSTHIDGTLVPVQEPSTASNADETERVRRPFESRCNPGVTPFPHRPDRDRLNDPAQGSMDATARIYRGVCGHGGVAARGNADRIGD